MVNNSVLARKRSLPRFLLGPRFSCCYFFHFSSLSTTNRRVTGCFNEIEQLRSIQYVCLEGGDSRTKFGSFCNIPFPSFCLGKQFSRAEKINVLEITVVHLGSILVEKCGNEGSHPYLNETKKVTLKFLRAAIDFIPLALEVAGDLKNSSFFFAHPGNDFAITAGKEEWKFYLSHLPNGNIHGCCVRKPTLHYIWDEFKKVFSRYVVIPVVLALTAS